jgi:hypothetical protein
MPPKRPSVAGAAIRPLALTPAGVWTAGLGFAMRVPGTTDELFVSCLHILGPAGGLPAATTPEALFAGGAPLVDAYDDAPLCQATRVLPIPGADTATPWRDLYALHLPEDHGCHLYDHRREPVAVGEPVFIAAPPRAEGPLEQRATITGVAGRVFGLALDTPQTSPRGWSGAAVLDRRARFVGMLSRGGAGRASAIQAGAVRALLRKALREAAERG